MMGVLAKVKSIFTGVVPDRDHGGWLSTSFPWNFWQTDQRLEGGHNNIVYACVQAYAQTIAQLPGQHLRTESNGGETLLTNTALHRFLYKPNEYQTLSDFLLMLVSCLLNEGNAYGIVQRNDRFEIVAIHLLPPGAVSDYVGENGEVFYHVSPEALANMPEAMLVPARDVLHVKLASDPSRPMTGLTPLQGGVGAAVAVNNSIMGQQAAFFSNMSRPSGVLSTDEKLTPKQMDQLREAWQDHSKGLNSGKVPILAWGVKWQSLSMNSVDAQLIESLRYSVEDIARAFRVPLPMIGVIEGSTYNNVYNLISSWKATGLGFVIEHIEQTLAQLFRLPYGERVNFDTNKLLRMDPKSRTEQLVTGITGGLIAPNEGRAQIGLAAVEGGDMPRVQQQMVALDYSPPEPEPAPAVAPEPEPEPEDEGDVEASFSESVEKARAMIEQAMKQ